MAPPARKGSDWVVNAAGRRVPTRLDGRTWRPFAGVGRTPGRGRRHAARLRPGTQGRDKRLPSIRAALENFGARDGWTLGFHHHLRNGEGVILPTLDAAREMGLRDLRLAQVALFPTHQRVIGMVEEGTVSRIEGSMNGPVGDFVGHGGLPHPAVLRTHGGRTRAVEAGDLTIDMSLIAASEADQQGNSNGVNGPHAFGAMAYGRIGWEYAEHVVVVTDNLAPYPVVPHPVEETRVDAVVEVDSIGEPQGIVSGTTRVTEDPVRLEMAERSIHLLDEAGLLRDGFSFQAGAGGTSLAAVKYLGDVMADRGIKGSFAMGGVTRYVVRMLEEGTVGAILDGQAFDLESVISLRDNPRHAEINPYRFANPHTGSCVVQSLDACFLGATEVDLDFNVNVNTHSDGRLLHGTGGHSDAAEGSKVTIVFAPIARKDNPIIRKRVTTVSTPGEAVDAVVTDAGIAVNPANRWLVKQLEGTDLPLRSIDDLEQASCDAATCPPLEPNLDEEDVVAVIEYRDGTILDVVYRLLER
ncbi:MAG: citrate lyase subunit alpha [Thermoplasmata archaeon]|nr:citrate lyase subunit alpha [Thermoplasmata archaeon]NIS14093.1 citrate lyase subunit alpha [Thermoplasmata archaeon]NIT79795.1 citrate lyase subunit alpha [Thermoplasmata archaeon]NIV80666.1 citrate lyase subunit alpha [Thermoplasmata archaeon]NIW84482.1 citrate lyase subunit alpha [Thermoplasmata archaeon]